MGANICSRRRGQNTAPGNPRYTIGTHVLCRTGQYEWSLGMVVALNYREPDWPAGIPSAPYQVKIFDDGRLIFVPRDIPELCRKYVAPAWEQAMPEQDLQLLRVVISRDGCEKADYLGRTPLLSCLETGWQEGALFLLAQRADPCKTFGPERSAPIHLAVMSLARVVIRDLDKGRIMFSRKGSVITAVLETSNSQRDDIDANGLTYISYDAREGKLTWAAGPDEGPSSSILRPLLRSWVPAKLASLAQGTSVMTQGLPKADSRLPLVKGLLEARADANAQNEDPDNDLDNYTSNTYNGLEQRQHRSALHYVAETGEVELCEQLISARATIDLEDRFKMTPLDIAVEEGSLTVADVLLRSAADPNRGNMRRGLQQTTVHQVANEGHAKLLELLLKHGGKVNAVGKQEMTPLHLAARKKHVEAVKVLLQSRADVELLDKSGRNPGQYAMANQSSGLTKALALDESLQLSDRIALLEKTIVKQASTPMEDGERQSLLKSLYAV